MTVHDIINRFQIQAKRNQLESLSRAQAELAAIDTDHMRHTDALHLARAIGSLSAQITFLEIELKHSQ